MTDDIPTWVPTVLAAIAIVGFAAAILGLLLPGPAGAVAGLVAVSAIVISPVARLVLVLPCWQQPADLRYLLATAAVIGLITLTASLS